MKIDTYRMNLEGIRFRGRHGASRAERDLPQDFVATIDVELPVSSLPMNDSYRNVTDYGRLAEIVADEGTKTSHRLLETLARKIVARILAESDALSVVVRVRKFGPPTPVSVDSAAIEIRGTRT